MTHRASVETSSADAPNSFPTVAPADIERVRRTIIDWFESAARDLPWREAGTSAWAILVSEIMSQQTPVARVEPRWQDWMERWPTPADLAEAPTAEVLRRWDRLGYPRRALRLQEAARVIAEERDNVVPDTEEELHQLPGIGSYTAAAVASFAHGQRTTVLDTNVRRVLIRLFAGRERPTASPGRRETEWAAQFVPAIDHVKWNAGVMEFGALVCTARTPDCDSCPLQDLCAWNRLGRPTSATKPRTQKWAGTDRQLRGAIMGVLKSAHEEAESAGAEQPPTSEADAVRVDLFTTSITALSPDLVDTLGTKTAAALAEVRELSTDADRIERLIDDLVFDGLAQSREGLLRLPA